jgi:hypothetical protein
MATCVVDPCSCGRSDANRARRKQIRYSRFEICSLYERCNGRDQLAAAVAGILKDLEPTKGIQLLPQFD